MENELNERESEGQVKGATTKDETYNSVNTQFLDFSQLNNGNDTAETDNVFENQEDNYFTPSNVTLASPTAIGEDEADAGTTKPESEDTEEGTPDNTIEDGDRDGNEGTGDIVETEANGNEDASEGMNGNGGADADEDTTKVEEVDGDEKEDQPEPESETEVEGEAGEGTREGIEVTATVEASPPDSEETEAGGSERKDDKKVEEVTETNVQTLFGFRTTDSEAEVQAAETVEVENEAVAPVDEIAAEDENVEVETKENVNEVTEAEPPEPVAGPSEPEAETAAVQTNEPEALLQNQNDNEKKEEPQASEKGKPKKKEFKITVPRPFKLHEGRAKAEDPKPEGYKFKARPAPKKILAPTKPIEIKAKANKLTHPVQPQFKSDARLQERHDKKESELTKQTSNDGAKASTHASTNSLPFKPPSPSKAAPSTTPTKIKPFSFEERNKEIQKKKQMRLQEKLEKEEAKPFKFVAKPAPVFRSKLTKTVSDPIPTTTTKLTNGKVADKGKPNKNRQANKKPVKPTTETGDLDGGQDQGGENGPNTQDMNGNANEAPESEEMNGEGIAAASD